MGVSGRLSLRRGPRLVYRLLVEVVLFLFYFLAPREAHGWLLKSHKKRRMPSQQCKMVMLHNENFFATYMVFWEAWGLFIGEAMAVGGGGKDDGVVEKNAVAVMLRHAMRRVISLDDIDFCSFRARKLCWLTLADPCNS